MLTVTEAARGRLLCKLVNKNAGDNEAWRFTRQYGGWKLRLDQTKPNDTMLAHEGRNVLLLDENVSRKMTKMTLDAIGVQTESRLTLRTD